MSANNQILVKEYKGKYYVFTNIQAESWVELDENNQIIEGRDNELTLKTGVGPFDTRDEAYIKALELDQDDDFGGTEYGVVLNKLQKDNSDVVIVE